MKILVPYDPSPFTVPNLEDIKGLKKGQEYAVAFYENMSTSGVTQAKCHFVEYLEGDSIEDISLLVTIDGEEWEIQGKLIRGLVEL